jgi:thiol-disulfide isomerase/thioredoxin
LIVAALVGVPSWRCGAARASQTDAPPPTDAGIKLRGIDGEMYDIAEMKGKIVLVSFGATWCAPCAAELRALEELQTEYRDKPVRFLWVSLDRREQLTDGALRDFVKANKLSFPVLRDPTQLTFAQFSTRMRLPYVIFFDREGRLAPPRHTGMAEPELYKKTIRENLDKLLMAGASTTPVEAAR